MSRAWMPLYVADYLADTAHLDATESGAYLHLIMHYWQTGGLPTDAKKLARIARLSDEQWSSIAYTISAFFDVTPAGWRHDRIERELEEARIAYEKRANAGRKGGKAKPKQEHCSSNASALPKQSQSPFSNENISPSTAHALRRDCLEIVGTEPVALAQDWQEIDALALEGVTAEDVLNGMRAAMAERSFRPKAWKQLAGWCRRAAKDRLASTPKPISSAPPRAGPPPRRSTLEGAVARILEKQNAAGSNVSGANRPDAFADCGDAKVIDLTASG